MAKEAAFTRKMKGRLTSEEDDSREKEVTVNGDSETVRSGEELGKNNEDKTWLRNTSGVEGESETGSREGETRRSLYFDVVDADRARSPNFRSVVLSRNVTALFFLVIRERNRS
jgi:hypothetical protein